MNRHERRKAKALRPEKTFSATFEQIREMCDALFHGMDPDDMSGEHKGQHGWVDISTSDKGRQAIEAVFPNAVIEWRHPSDNLLGWAEFTINVPRLAAGLPVHHLPLEITKGDDLNQSTPDALAFLLAMAAKRQGARVAVQMQDGTVDFFVPQIQ
jgi:hypothetical protein